MGNFFKNRIYQWENSRFDQTYELEDFESLIDRFALCYGKEMIKTLHRLLIFTNDKQIGGYRFKTLMKVAKAASNSHPRAVVEVLKKQSTLGLKMGREFGLVKTVKFLNVSSL
ncbi:MAG: hypothetical protein HWD61_11270 [Parachlamydiaceae bacterium]|nr:MAG: hypothetical protein HWD61_11270 [Parachlamydiaceae bacterium]